MIVDAHHHVWRLARGDYGWLTPALAPIHRDFDLADLTPSLNEAGVTATVLVQAAPTEAETRYLIDVARQSDGLVQAVVGWVDLAAPDAARRIADLAAEPLVKGVRPMLQDLPDPEWILRKDVGRGLDAVEAAGLRLDALVTPVQLPALVDLLDCRPGLAVVLDHGGKPPIRTGARQPWADLISRVATHPHVICKLSGLVTEAGPAWTAETLKPWVDHLIDCFGPRRLMWGSDWPVVNLAGGWRRWRAATEVLLAGLTPADRAVILGGTASRFYGLG